MKKYHPLDSRYKGPSTAFVGTERARKASMAHDDIYLESPAFTADLIPPHTAQPAQSTLAAILTIADKIIGVTPMLRWAGKWILAIGLYFAIYALSRFFDILPAVTQL